MENETENGNSQNADNQQGTAELSALQEKLLDLESKNRKLFERAKTAEGFTKQEDGSWVKVEKPKPGRPAKEEKQDASPDPDTLGLLQQQMKKLAFRTAGITADDEVALAEKLQQETGKDWDSLFDTKYFKNELEDLRTTKANAAATSNIQGSGTANQAKNSPEYWVAKGTPPTREQVPDRKARVAIARAMMQGAKTGKTFYND